MDSKSAEEGPDNLVGNSKLKSPNSGSDSNTMDSGFQDGGPPTMNTDRNRNDAFPPNVDGSQVCSESNNIPQDGPNPSMNSDAFGRMSENGNPGQMQGYGSFPNNRPNMAMNDQHGGPTNNTGSHEFAGSNGQFGQYGPQNMRGVYPQSSRAPGMGMRPPGGPGGVPMMGGNYPHGGQRLPMSGATIQQQGGPTPTLNQLLQNSGSSHRMQGNYGEQSMGYGHRPPSDMPPGMSSNYMQHGNWNQQGPRQPSVNPYQQTGVNPNYRGQGAQMMPNMRPGGGAVGPGYNQQGGAPFGGHQYPPTSQRFPMGQSPGPGRHTPGSIPGQPPFNQQQMQGQYPPSSQSGFSRGQPGQQGFMGNQSASSPGYMTSPQSSPSMHQPQTPGQGSHGASSQGPSQMPVPTRPQSNQSISSQENAVVGGNDELGEGTGNSAVNSRTTPTSSVNPSHPSVSGLLPTPSPGGSQGSRSNTPASVTGNQTGSPMPPPRPPSNQVEGPNRIQSPMAAQGYHPQQVMPPPIGPNQMGNYGNKIGPGMMGNQQMGPYPPQQNSQFPNQGNYGRPGMPSYGGHPNAYSSGAAGGQGPPQMGPSGQQVFPGQMAMTRHNYHSSFNSGNSGPGMNSSPASQYGNFNHQNSMGQGQNMHNNLPPASQGTNSMGMGMQSPGHVMSGPGQMLPSHSPKGAQVAAQAAVMAAASTAGRNQMMRPQGMPENISPTTQAHQPRTFGGAGSPMPQGQFPGMNPVPNNISGGSPGLETSMGSQLPGSVSSSSGQMAPPTVSSSASMGGQPMPPPSSTPSARSTPNSSVPSPSVSLPSAPSKTDQAVKSEAESSVSSLPGMDSTHACSSDSETKPIVSVANSDTGDTSTTLTQSIKCPITTEAQATGTSSSEPLTMKSEPHPSIPPSMPPHPMMRPPMPPPIPNPQAMPSPGPNMVMPQTMDMMENSPAEKYRPKENISHPPQAVSSAQGSASVHEDFENVSSPSWPGTPKSSQYEGVNKLYDMGDEPDRRPFLDALFALMEEKGTPLTAMPTITKQPLDLYKMYMSVKERGGCIEVSRGKRWRDICACLNINTSGSAGFAVRKNYIKFVLPYECRYDRGNCDPTPIIAQVEQLSQKKDKRKENAANKAAASAIQNSMPNSMDPFRHPSVPNNQGFDGFMPGGQRPPPIPNTDMPGPPNTSIPPGTNMMVNQMNTDGIPPQGPNGNMMVNSGMMPNHMNSNMPNSQLIPPSIPPGGHDSISVQDPFADQPPSGNQYPRQPMNSQMPPFSSMPQQSMQNSYYNSRPQMTSNIPYSSSQSGSFSGPPGASMPRMPSQPSEQMGGPFPPRGMTPQEGFPNRGSMPSSSMPPEGSMANSQFPPNQSSISHSNQNNQLQFPYGPQYNRERFGPPQQPQQQSGQPAPAPPAAGPPGNNSSMPGMHGPPNSMGPSPGPMGSEPVYPGRFAGSSQIPHPPASGQQDQFSPSQGQSFQGQRSFQGQEPPFSSYQGQQPVMSQSPFMGQKSQSMVRDMGLSTPPKSYPPNMERSNTFPMNSFGQSPSGPPMFMEGMNDPLVPFDMMKAHADMRRDSQQWTPSRPGWPPGGANSPYMQRPRASPHRFVPQKIQKQGSVTNQYPPRKEIVFPPDSVESTQPLLVKRRKARSKDVAPVDPWKLMLALKSGLIAQSSWALDTLSILLYDDSTVAYFSLNHLPGLIEVLLDHFRHCLREIFQLCSDMELGKSAAKAPEEEDVKDSPKQCLMNGSGDFTWLTRQGKAVKLEDDSKDESFVLDDKKWDVYDKFCSSREDWDIGYGDISDNIILNLEHSGQRDFFRQCFFGKKHTEVSEESETRELDQDTSSEKHEECKSSAGDDVLNKCENQSMCSPKSGVDTEAGCEIKGSCTDCNISVKKEQEDSDIKTDPAIKTEQSEEDQSCQKDTATEGEQANSPGNNVKQENTVNADGQVNIDIDQLLRKRLKRKLEVSEELENEAYQHDNSPLSLISDSQEELSRRCICVSNIFRSLSFIPSNHWEMSQHHGLILVLGKLLTLHHNHPQRKRIHRGFDREEIPDNGEDYVETGDRDWWWHTLDLLRENTLVILANITGQMALIKYPEEVCSPLLDGLLHWATCPAACAQDPLPTMSLNSVLSPQRLVLEAMCKLCVQENNVDLILAMPPFSRVVQLFSILVKNLADKKIQVLREFSIVLLSSLVQGDSSAARAVAMEHPSVSLLLDFIENAEHQAMQVAKAHGVNMLRENPEMMGTSLDMLRRAAVTLKFMAMVPSNRSFFMHHEQRLLDLVTSQILDQNVAAILAEVLFHCSSS